jgi:thymidylate kinase
MRKDNSKLLIIEGISGSGKSTLLRSLNVSREFQDHHWHRFSATKWVYGTLYRREIDLEQIRRDEDKIQEIWPTTLVNLTCDPNVALERKAFMPGEHIERGIGLANELFIIYHEHLTVIQNKILVNTDDKTVEECTDLILKKVLGGG